MLSNRKILTEYINQIGGKGSFVTESLGLPRKGQKRKCVKCGKPYMIYIPYDLCNPKTRDLCDDCMFPGW